VQPGKEDLKRKVRARTVNKKIKEEEKIIRRLRK
jgi:hypothetical protein